MSNSDSLRLRDQDNIQNNMNRALRKMRLNVYVHVSSNDKRTDQPALRNNLNIVYFARCSDGRIFPYFACISETKYSSLSSVVYAWTSL